MSDFLILGGGLAGLSAAYHLEKAGAKDWLMLEGKERVGGLCRSVEQDGFTFDHAIHILYSSDPYAAGLIKTLLQGNFTSQRRESWVYSFGAYTLYPWQANTYGMPADVVKECLMGVIKATYEKQGPPAADFGAWCRDTFGEGLARHFMAPYNRKLWATELSNMTAEWIKDRVMTPSLTEVIEGALKPPGKDYGPNAVFWYPEKGGIESLPKGFGPYLDAKRMVFNTEAGRVFWKDKKVVSKDGRAFPYKRLISSIPLPVLASIMEPGLPEEFGNAAGRLEHNTIHALNIAVRRDSISPYHWVYFPEERFLFHRISFPRNFASSMAPDGWSSITVEVSASKYRRLPPIEDMKKMVVSGLEDAGVIRGDDHVEIKSVLVLNPAYVIYNHTHRKDVDSLHGFFKENGISPCGRFGDWEYLNMDHSILSGKRAAQEGMA